jgi:hypothetical protein
VQPDAEHLGGARAFLPKADLSGPALRAALAG